MAVLLVVRTLGVVVVLVMAASACGDATDEAIETTTTTSVLELSISSTTTNTTTTTTEAPDAVTSTTMAPEVELGQSCTDQGARYSVEYPAGWSTNSGEVSPPCSYFHPEPFEVPEATEVFDLAITLRVESVAYETVSEPDVFGERELSRTGTTIDGRRAVRVETESTGELLLPEGVRSYRYAVDLDGETFVAATFGVEALDFETNKDVLDQMMDSLDLTTGT